MNPDLEAMSAQELDEFAAFAHALERTEGVSIIDATGPHSLADDNAAHGSNTVDEMV